MAPKLPGYQIGESIYEGERTEVYRGIRLSDSLKVAIKFLRNPYPSFSELVQFRNQYAIAKNLNPTGIVRPLSLERYGNGYALVMEDLGAISLDKILAKNKSLDIKSCLDIAIQLADILHKLERQRVIHKDIKPANILILPETKEVKLIDFSIASLLPREAQEIKNINVLEGTLAYISPEQTGRMNRGIDYRSDFYSLGVTLYQLLTGVLPFSSSDPIELVHCHISQQPVPPAEVNNTALGDVSYSQKNPPKSPFVKGTFTAPLTKGGWGDKNLLHNSENYCNSSNIEIPPVVSDIVMKLMAKNAEERYQSALGLKFDLEKCLKQWLETDKIEPFELATHDIAGRFIIPEKLYGREAEVQRLLEVFERVAEGQTEMMLVAGFSGIGKTAVVNEVHKPIVRQRGYFIKGKFDQFQRNIPFSAFLQAFRDLMEQLLAESDANLAQWQEQILEVLGENAQVIIDVIPQLERIIGKQPTVPQLSGSAAQNRFNLLFQKFIQVFTTPEHPLVIFIDDLQWADSGSLNLMQLLTRESDTGYLLLLGAYRDNEVSPVHPLMLTLDEIGKSGATINTITLAPLSENDLNCLVADTLSCSQELAKPLSELIYQKTQGNPFFATQFLKGLHEDELITFDRDKGYWHSNITEVRQLALTDDVVEFMASRLHKLPEPTQEMLKLAACIGNQFNLQTLAIVSQQSQMEVATDLWGALQEGLVLPLGETYKFFQGSEGEENLQTSELSVRYKFLHDRVQQAAYSLIPETAKEKTHLQIGKLLLNNTSQSNQEAQIFAIVSQLNIGVALISDQSDRQDLARLNLIAARKAKASIAYQAASNNLKIALELLTEDCWEKQYELIRDLYTEAALVAYLMGDFDLSDIYGQFVLERGKSILEKIEIFYIKIQSKSALQKFDEATEIALKVLDTLGVELDTEPPSLEQLEELKNLPELTDPYKLAALRILDSIMSVLYVTNPELAKRVIYTNLNLSVRYGTSSSGAISCVAHSYNSILFGVEDGLEKGYRLGKMGLELFMERFSGTDKEQISVVLHLFNGFVRHWKEPLRNSLATCLEAFQVGQENGENIFSTYQIICYLSHLFLVGEPLEFLSKQCQFYIEEFEKNNLEYHANFSKPYHQAALNLLGSSEHYMELIGEVFDETEYLPILHETKVGMNLCSVYAIKGQLAYLFEEIEACINCAEESRKWQDYASGFFIVYVNQFYLCLGLLNTYPNSSPQRQQEIILQVESDQKQMQYLARNAPANFQHKYDLVEAEKAKVLGEYWQATELYDRAIAGAKENEYIQEEALANELAAKFHLEWGKEKIARVYMQEAYYCYARWGAKAKTDRLEEKYPQLLAPILQQPYLQLQSSQTIASALTQTAGSSSTSSFILDWATAMKAAQSLSSEINLDKLVEALIKAAMENAGASGGILLLKQPSSWQVVARSSHIGGPLSSSEALDSSEIPTSVINKVKRTQETIIVNNFSSDTQFAADSYLLQGQPKSFLCTPILNQGKLVGILYLENHLAVGAFTGDRLEVLNLLCSQAAISLENARLYEQSQDYAEKLENSLTDLQQAQLQLVQSEKMSALGNLVAGVAHEINNPVGFIAGNLDPARDYLQDLFGLIDLYQEKYSDPEIEEEIEAIDLEFLRQDLPQLISSMREGTDRIRHISTSLRTFSRTDKEYKVPFDIHQGIESTLLILKHRLKANEERPAIEIVQEYGELPSVQCFPGQLNQVFMNLIANSIDAFEEANQGKTYAELEANPNRITIGTSVIDSEQVQIQIGDNGCGMKPETKERIFEQGFTTKAVGKGTGLGMAIAHQIVTEKHGGTIECQSELGQGTEFIISLPIS